MQVFKLLRGAYGGFLNGVGFAGICTDPDACPVVFRPFSGRFPVVFRPSSGRFPAVIRPFSGRISAVSRPFSAGFWPKPAENGRNTVSVFGKKLPFSAILSIHSEAP